MTFGVARPGVRRMCPYDPAFGLSERLEGLALGNVEPDVLADECS
jgi:hypothetical protein